MSNSKFSLTRNGYPICSVPLGEAATAIGEVPAVGELHICGFELEHREADQEYLVQVGDEPASSPRPHERDGRGIGSGRGRSVLWEDAAHFEGARGRVWVELYGRSLEPVGKWLWKAQLPVTVVPQKLSDLQYQAMFEELSALSAGLVFDLISKTARRLTIDVDKPAISARSAHLELNMVETIWASFAVGLLEISKQPATTLQLVRKLALCWGGDRMSVGGLARLAATGLDPRRSHVPRPFVSISERVHEAFDTIEHRIVLGFLRFLYYRVGDCVRRAENQIGAIQDERRYRDIKITDGPTLWESVDKPRIRRLEEACSRAEGLQKKILAAAGLPFLAGLTPWLRQPISPVFDNVAPYRRIRHEMLRYLNSALVTVEEAGRERIKSTSKMFEQWVFLQLASAFRESGLYTEGHEGLVQRSSERSYTVNIERGARVTFRSLDGRIISLRYEPWILPFVTAKERRETVYRRTSGDTPWSPDVLIEFLMLGDDPDQIPQVEYAVVIDAKYARRIAEYHWDKTTKYLEIRATRNSRQVVKQLWLAQPGEPDIFCKDSAIAWSSVGPNCPHDETVQGVLSFQPVVESASGEQATTLKPVAVVQEFVNGLLSYLDFKDLPPSRNVTS